MIADGVVEAVYRINYGVMLNLKRRCLNDKG